MVCPILSFPVVIWNVFPPRTRLLPLFPSFVVFRSLTHHGPRLVARQREAPKKGCLSSGMVYSRMIIIVCQKHRPVGASD